MSVHTIPAVQLDPCMHKWNTFSSKSTRFNPNFVLPSYIITPAEVGIRSCTFARECVSFVHAWMSVPTQIELCLHEQTHIVTGVACRVGSQQFLRYIACQLLPYLLLWFLVPLNFYLFLFYCIGLHLSALRLEENYSVYRSSVCMCQAHFCN